MIKHDGTRTLFLGNVSNVIVLQIFSLFFTIHFARNKIGYPRAIEPQVECAVLSFIGRWCKTLQSPLYKDPRGRRIKIMKFPVTPKIHGNLQF